MSGVYESFSVIYNVSKIFSMITCKYVKIGNHNKFQVSEKLVLSGSIALIFNQLYFFYNWSEKSEVMLNDSISKLIYYFQLFVTSVCIFSIFISRIVYKHLFVAVLNQLIQTDIEMQKVRIFFNSRRILLCTIKLIILQFAGVLVVLATAVYNNFSKGILNFLYFINFGMYLCFSILYFTQFIVFIKIIEQRFICLNQYLETKLVHCKKSKNILSKTVHTADLKIIGYFYFQLCVITKHVNRIFAFPLLMYFIHTLIVFLTHTYNLVHLMIYIQASGSINRQMISYFLFSCFWMPFYSFRTIYFTKNCEDLRNAVSHI